MKIYLVYNETFDKILKEEGMDIILTFANLRMPDDIPKGYKGILIDSGGYQAQNNIAGKRSRKLGRRIDIGVTIKAYADYLTFTLPEHPEIDGYFNLDYLGDIDRTLANQAYMEKRGLNPIPIWHPGEPDVLLDYYCSEYPYVAIGGVVGSASDKMKLTTKRLRYIFERILFKYTTTKFHILGIGISGSTVFRTVRPYSCDFSTWMNIHRFGNELFWNKDGLLSERRVPKKEDRDRIRVDKDFRDMLIRDSIQKIKIFNDRLENMNDSFQMQF